MKRVSNRDARTEIIEQRNFVSHTGNFSGFWGGKGEVGRLPEPWREQFYCRSRGDYVVYSYNTPIAWWTPETGWVIPDVKYSPTTSRHQSIVRLAVAR